MGAAAASPRTLASPVGSALARIALALTASLLAVFARVGRAVAADRTVRTAASSAVPFAISGNMVKWGVVTAVLGGAYVFRREETPILTETVIPEEDKAGQSAGSSAIDGLSIAAAALDDASSGSIAAPATPTDDGSLSSDLLRRMQELAAERAKAAEEDDSNDDQPPPSDSTDSWATGNTAVLEPPKPDETPSQGGLLDGEPAVEFPTGFPLVDGELESEPAAASEEQIAMLQRMFGSTSSEE